MNVGTSGNFSKEDNNLPCCKESWTDVSDHCSRLLHPECHFPRIRYRYCLTRRQKGLQHDRLPHRLVTSSFLRYCCRMDLEYPPRIQTLRGKQRQTMKSAFPKLET